MRIRSEVAGTIVLFKSRQPETRPFLGGVDLYQKEAFVVAKRDVVTWPVFLDQLAFEQERFRLAAHGVRLEIPNGIEHGTGLQVGLRHFRWQKIGAHAFAQVPRFADINNPIKAIAHQVDTGFMRHFVHSFLQIRFLFRQGCHCWAPMYA